MVMRTGSLAHFGISFHVILVINTPHCSPVIYFILYRTLLEKPIFITERYFIFTKIK